VITAIVLAGGRSSRFGSDKLVAELDGASLLARTITAVAPVVDGVVVAVSGLPDEVLVAEVPVALIHDREPYRGPLVALANALGTAVRPYPVADLAIVVGGDMPRLVPAVLKAMLDRLTGDPALDAVVLEVTGAPRRQVLPLALRCEPAFRAARAILELEDRSLRILADRLRAIELPEVEWRALDPDGDTLADVDTPADLDRLRSGDIERRAR
jgi:molybdenum cofactor guanylyltransferase